MKRIEVGDSVVVVDPSGANEARMGDIGVVEGVDDCSSRLDQMVNVRTDKGVTYGMYASRFRPAGYTPDDYFLQDIVEDEIRKLTS